MPKRSPLRAVITEYKQLKTAAGGSGSSGGGTYSKVKHGEKVVCKVVRKSAKDFYSVVIPEKGLPGFLVTYSRQDFKVGQEILGMVALICPDQLGLVDPNDFGSPSQNDADIINLSAERTKSRTKAPPGTP